MNKKIKLIYDIMFNFHELMEKETVISDIKEMLENE